ncbi:C1 family peptidase [Mesorhizobium sp. M0323]|uniref:C1 family peptidase n=1 Tax=Mesorhizobium sp. M0323 TaxID=2956938 RepID=UPI00333655A9
MRRLGFLLFLTISTLVTQALAQDKSTGLIFLSDTAYQSIPLASTPVMGAIPTSADLSAEFPVPGNQKHQSSCVAWAVSYALKSYQENKERRWGLNSASNLFSPAFVYNQIKQSSNCEGGSLITDALNLLRRDGVAVLADFPYDDRACSAVPTDAVKQSARPFAIADWRRVNVQDDMEIKTQVSAGFPVVVGIIVDGAFKELRAGQIYTTPNNLRPGGHAMVIVGYDDSKVAYKVINSWGTTWADQGFGWINYQTFRSLVREGYVAQDIVVNPAPPPPPGPNNPPTPPSPPVPVQVPVVSLGMPAIAHNVPVPTPNQFGSAPGMQILTPGQINGGAGHTLQIVAHFTYAGGPPLMANPAEQVFRDVSGLVAAGTQAAPVGTNSESLSTISILIPYYALNFPQTNGMNSYNLAMNVMVYVDGKVAAQSPPVPFGLRW